ncbi:hypothetical protein GCM10023216_11790 [Isoptericola chiayiensis]|uniref:Glycine zipper domain-containing protein n=2 Tax=Isoptericola chiayiensis TaxID=579446 RepID=A0ABP8YB78_9MICO
MREARGDRAVAARLVFARLEELGWITAHERDVVTRMHATGRPAPGRDTSERKGPIAAREYFAVRDMHDELLARGDASPVALVLASSAVGSYEATPGDDGTTVVFAKSNRDYQGLLTGAGAIIGGALGGPTGAAIGGAVGGVIGYVVDDCKD